MKIKGPAFQFGCLFLAGAGIAALPARGQVTQELLTRSVTAPVTISGVRVSQAGQETAVRINGTGELHYKSSRMENPPRVVLDFAGTRSLVSRNLIPSDYSPVRDVRVGQPDPTQTRVVIDLSNAAAFNCQSERASLTCSFASSGATSAAKLPDMPLPTFLTGKNSSLGHPVGPVEGPAAPAQPREQAGQAAAVMPSNPAQLEKRYTGDPISVNLKDVDLKDFFRLIHEISGLNVVLDPSVKGTVTLVLDEVPWDQGLDIVLRNNGLTKEIDGNVLRIATQETLKHEADERRDLARAQSEAVETVTATRVLSYAKAELMVVTLKKFLTPRGDVYADPRSNTLIVRDIPESIPKIDNLLRQLDRRSQQVEIDARVVQASRTFARELGTQLAYSFGAGNNVFGGSNAVGTSPISRTFFPGLSSSPALIAGTPPLPATTGAPMATAVAMPLATNLAATAATSGLTYLFTSPNFALDFMLTAMESKGVGKILSEPKGVTQNNQKLTVKQGTKLPIQTTVNNTVSVQYIDAVLKLEVTPQITSDGTVFLDVTVENTQIDQGIPRIQGTPALDTQSTETKVLINDGGTIVIGGVGVNSQNTSVDQVPLLGNVPIIGNLFKHTSVHVSSQELLFFVTPRILPS